MLIFLTIWITCAVIAYGQFFAQFAEVFDQYADKDPHPGRDKMKSQAVLFCFGMAVVFGPIAFLAGCTIRWQDTGNPFSLRYKF